MREGRRSSTLSKCELHEEISPTQNDFDMLKKLLLENARHERHQSSGAGAYTFRVECKLCNEDWKLPFLWHSHRRVLPQTSFSTPEAQFELSRSKFGKFYNPFEVQMLNHGSLPQMYVGL